MTVARLKPTGTRWHQVTAARARADVTVSICGLGWARHSCWQVADEGTRPDCGHCIRALKAATRAANDKRRPVAMGPANDVPVGETMGVWPTGDDDFEEVWAIVLGP